MIDISRYPARFPPPFADAWGDDPYGLWAEFILPVTEDEEATRQRLRWIEPGSFLMGSPEGERGRDINEGPRHLVTFSQGFWLADTPCTQVLWQAVMGDNPSRFQSPDRPVEQVSWEGVQLFLRKLETLLPEIKADLPTEAEWEYACRAGTDTPFFFGENIMPEQVNYNGNHPYTHGKKGVIGEKPSLRQVCRLIPGAFVECMATSGNGAPMV